MELRVLRYFLAVAREESISDAAEFLHITQPTLSRQLMDLEEELGKDGFGRRTWQTALNPRQAQPQNNAYRRRHAPA